MSKERTRRRTLAITAVTATALALGFLAFSGIGDNLVYYWSPADIEKAGNKAIGAQIRLGGMVVPGTIEYGDGLALKFHVTDGVAQTPVAASTVPPAMFREMIGVVLEGTMHEDGVFHSQRMLVKHDNEYRPPGEHDSRSMKEMMKSMQFEEAEQQVGY